jgi:serine/threonine-protein kinase
MREGVIVSDKYKLLRKIGEGGMGSVWLARNEITEREFAIKFMSAELAYSESLTTRFLQEAKLAGRLRHPSLLEIFDAGVAPELENAPFLVMELLDGIPLDDAIQKAGRLPVGVAIEIMSTVTQAMAVVHDKGIVHRDLKPANVFMHRPGTGAIVPKVLDFGISKVTTEDGPVKPSGLTQTGHVLGSPTYMSPEQARSDKTIDARSDVHALGVMLWECLVGRPPFGADNYNTLVVEIMVGERPRLEDVLPGVSPSLAKTVARAFAVKREERFPSASALADALDEEMRRMGHVRVLETRRGAEEFFGLLREAAAERAPNAGSSTTSGQAVPAGSAMTMRSDPPQANPMSTADTVALQGAGSLPPPSRQARPAAPESRTKLVPLAIGGLALVLIAAAGAIWGLSGSKQESATDPAPAADSVRVVAAPVEAPSVVVEEPTAPVPSVSESAAPSASPPPVAAPLPAAPSRTTKPTSTPKPTPKPTHHGVDDDGL